MPRRSPGRRLAAGFLACATAAFVIGRASVAAGSRADGSARTNGSLAGSAATAGPRYDQRGRLLRPDGVLEWVLVGSSVGLGYSERERHGRPPGWFHQVYLEPSALRSYAATGEFPDGTMLALAIRAPEPGAPPARGGHAAGELAALEMAVKDPGRFEGAWAYFDFTAGGGALRDRAGAFPPAACQACHARHAARDNVFQQFYPLLRELDRAREDTAAQPAPARR